MKLEEIEKICNEALPGPWFFNEADREGMLGDLCWDGNPHNELLKLWPRNAGLQEIGKGTAEFIAMARTELPKLLAVVKAAKLACDDIDLCYEDNSGNLDKLGWALEELEKE